jgi:hypothetical protein
MAAGERLEITRDHAPLAADVDGAQIALLDSVPDGGLAHLRQLGDLPHSHEPSREHPCRCMAPLSIIERSAAWFGAD